MAINLRTGQPGHGKSYGSVVEIRDALDQGKYVATNVPLADDWALRMSRSNQIRRLFPGRVEAVAQRYRLRLYQVEDLSELRRIKLPACGKCRGCRNGPGCQKEARGLAVLDEAHKWLNARTWDADETGQAKTKAEATMRRLEIVRFFSEHRHRGWDVELITQDEQNLDRQVRSLFETHTHLRNMKKLKILGLIALTPFNFFVAITHWHDNDKTRMGIKTYMLSKQLADCYDTFGGARAFEEQPDAIDIAAVLRERHGQPAAPATAGRPPGPARAGAAGRPADLADQPADPPNELAA